MRFLFLTFALLVPIDAIIAVNSQYQMAGLALFIVGGISGIVCSFITCPCCKHLSGVFFKGFVGGVFPFGFCAHCRTSYLNAKGCKHGY